MSGDGEKPVSGYYIRIRGKIHGPFDVARLKKLQARGQFSRAHEVSMDKRSWQPAGTLQDLFAAPEKGMPQVDDATSSNLEFFATPPEEVPTRTAAPAEWHYSVGEERRGPVTLADLQQAVRERRLGRDDLVWRAGLSAWEPAGHLQELFPRSAATSQKTRWVVVGGLVVAGAILLTLAGIYGYGLITARYPVVSGSIREQSPSVDARPAEVPVVLDDPKPTQVPIISRDAGSTIRNITAEAELADGIGLVVCGIHVVGPDGDESEIPLSTGSCFAISPDGFLVTNQHVVVETKKLANARLFLQRLREKDLLEVRPRIWIFFGKEKYDASIVYVSDHFDLGILKVARVCKHFFRLSNSDKLPRGKKVIACGFPGAARRPLSVEEAVKDAQMRALAKKIEGQFKLRDFEYAMTDGSISRIASEEGTDRKWIQHTANINPGNSGGPLLDEDATVIGINTLQAKDASGVFFSLATPQLKDEIRKFVAMTEWK